MTAKPSQEDHHFIKAKPSDIKKKKSEISLKYIYIYNAKQTQELTASIDPRTTFA